MSMHDPSGLLSRVPELEAFAQHPKILAAIESGRPREVYAALKRAHRRGELADRENIATQLLAHRRWFLEAASPPKMFTLNGVGTSLYGEAERDETDGSYIATFFLVFVFLPIFPIAQYLVKPAPTRGWYFFGKVPNGPFVAAWRTALFATAAALIAFGAFGAWHATRYVDVTVVNALPFPITATIGGRRIDVAADQHANAEVPAGRQTVVVEAEGHRVIERGNLDVSAGADVLAWNVVGAASLVYGTTHYASPGVTAPPDTQDRSYCGTRAIRIDSVDFALTPPPGTISVRNRSGYESRTVVSIATEGPFDCVDRILTTQTVAEATRHASDLLAALNYPARETLGVLSTLERAGASTGLVAIAERAIALHGDELDAHRALQDALDHEGRRAEANARYRELAANDPSSADWAYLAIRLGSDGEIATLGAESSTRFPAHARIHNLVAHAHLRLHRFEEAIREFEVVETNDLELWSSEADLVADAYAGASRTAELIPRLLRAHETRPNGELLAAYARLAPARATPAPRALLEAMLHDVEDDGKAAFVAIRLLDSDRAATELPRVSPSYEPILAKIETIVASLRSTSGDSLSLAVESEDGVLLNLGPRTAIVLAFEALRVSHEHPLVDRLLTLRPQDPDLRIFVDAVRAPVEPEAARFVTPSLRALLAIARVTRADLPPEERARLVEAARLDDVGTGLFHLAVARALGG